MLRCDIGGFADVVDEIVKFCLFQLPLLVRRGCPAVSAWFASQRAISMGQLKFPPAIASNGRLELVHLVIKPISAMRIFGAAFAGDDGPDIEAVDRVFGQFSA